MHTSNYNLIEHLYSATKEKNKSEALCTRLYEVQCHYNLNYISWQNSVKQWTVKEIRATLGALVHFSSPTNRFPSTAERWHHGFIIKDLIKCVQEHFCSALVFLTLE